MLNKFCPACFAVSTVDEPDLRVILHEIQSFVRARPYTYAALSALHDGVRPAVVGATEVVIGSENAGIAELHRCMSDPRLSAEVVQLAGWYADDMTLGSYRELALMYHRMNSGDTSELSPKRAALLAALLLYARKDFALFSGETFIGGMSNTRPPGIADALGTFSDNLPKAPEGRTLCEYGSPTDILCSVLNYLVSLPSVRSDLCVVAFADLDSMPYFFAPESAAFSAACAMFVTRVPADVRVFLRVPKSAKCARLLEGQPVAEGAQIMALPSGNLLISVARN